MNSSFNDFIDFYLYITLLPPSLLTIKFSGNMQSVES